AGRVGGLLVTSTGINRGMGGPTSVKAFLMIMIGGAGVISGAIAGGFILGMMESVGLTVLAAYGDITYLVIFASLMVFLAIRPQGLMGKPWGWGHDRSNAIHRKGPPDVHNPPCRRPGLPAWRLRPRAAVHQPDGALGLLLYAHLGRASVGGRRRGLADLLHRPDQHRPGCLCTYGWLCLGHPDHAIRRQLLADAAAGRVVLRRRFGADRPAHPAVARGLLRHGHAGPDRGGPADRPRAARHQRRQGDHLDPAAGRTVALRPDH